MDRVAQVEWYCDRVADHAGALESLIIRMVGVVEGMTIEELGPWGGSKRRFMSEYIKPKVGREMSTLYNFRRCSRNGFTADHVATLGITNVILLSEHFPERGQSRDKILEAIPAGATTEKVQGLIAEHKGIPEDAVRRAKVEFPCTVEQAREFWADVEKWRADCPTRPVYAVLAEVFAEASTEPHKLLPGYRAMRAELDGLLDLLPANHATRVGELLAQVVAV